MIRRTPIAFVTREHGGFTRGLLAGIDRFNLAHPGWVCRDFPCDERGLDHLRKWGPAGVLAHLTEAEDSQAVRDLKIPIVNTSSAREEPGLAQVVIDNRGVGRLAGEHLMDRGFKHLAFLGKADRLTSSHRLAGLAGVAEERGGEVHVYDRPIPRHGSGRRGKPTRAERRVIRWLCDLPRPLGLLGWIDDAAVAALTWAQEAGLIVPEEVAIVGVNNSQPFGSIPLSSVSLPIDQIGYAAAELLAHILRGERTPDTTIRFAPIGVVARASSDATATADPLLRTALAAIRDMAHLPVGVDDIALASDTGRRSLERRFRDALGSTVLEELHTARLRLAMPMLIDTDLTIQHIADACGFSSPLHFRRVFRARHGCTPSEHRDTARGG